MKRVKSRLEVLKLSRNFSGLNSPRIHNLLMALMSIVTKKTKPKRTSVRRALSFFLDNLLVTKWHSPTTHRACEAKPTRLREAKKLPVSEEEWAFLI